MCHSSQEACSRREINEPSGMASLLCCRSFMKAAIPTVTSPMLTTFLRYSFSPASSKKEAVDYCWLNKCFTLKTWWFKLHVNNVFLSGIIITTLHGGHVFCHRGQEDCSGIHLSQHIHLWPLWWSWCKFDIPIACYFLHWEKWSLLPLKNQLSCVVYFFKDIVEIKTLIEWSYFVSLKLLVEILMRPTLTMQKKKTKSKQDCLHLRRSLHVFT